MCERRWVCEPVSPAHPCLASLAAHWGFSSGSASPVEIDLSGNEYHLRNLNAETDTTQRLLSSPWLRSAPHQLRVLKTAFVVETLQDATESGEHCRFQIAIRYRNNCQQQQHESFHARHDQCDRVCPRVLFMRNFSCFKSTSVTNNGEGKGIVALLKECVRVLPTNAVVGVLPGPMDASNASAGGSRCHQEATHAPFVKMMTPSGKVRW